MLHVLEIWTSIDPTPQPKDHFTVPVPIVALSSSSHNPYTFILNPKKDSDALLPLHFRRFLGEDPEE